MPINAPSPPRILILEDNPLDALLLQETLRESGEPAAEMPVAMTLGDALEMLGRKKFDLVLADLSLPDSNGLDTFTRLSAHTPEIPIIILTGLENEALGLEAVRAGAQEYIVKRTLNGHALWRTISYAMERQSLEHAVRESEKRYRRLLASVTDYIYTVQLVDGRAVSTIHGPGCERVTGYTPEDLSTDRHLWYRMVHEDDRAAVLRQALRVLAREPAALEHRIIHRDGSIRWVRHTPVLRRDEQGRLNGYDGLISDITERKLAEEALRKAVDDLQKSQVALESAHRQLIEAEKMETVGRMAAGVAHEVQNPLQILLMSVDFLAQRLPPEDSVSAGVVEEMRHAAKRADTIIRGLLEFSHPDAAALARQDINMLVDNALLLVRPSLATRQIAVKTEFAPNLPLLPLDGAKIAQVFAHLFANALDAMPQGGVLKVSTTTECLTKTRHDPGAREASHFYAGDTVVVLTIEDTGTGIPADSLRKIYDPFFTTKATGVGTGLGLTLVKRIVEQHGGEIEIANREKGGVQVRLVFPTRNRKAD